MTKFPNLTSTHKLLLWLGQALLLALLLSYCLLNKPLTFNANLTALFSSNTENQWQNIQKSIDASANTTQIYLVGHQQQSIAEQAASQLADEIAAIEGVASVSAQLKSVPDQQLMINSYVGAEQQLLRPKFRQALQQQNNKQSNEQIFQLQFELLNQLGDQLVVNTWSKDPSLAFAHFLNRSPFPASNLFISASGYLMLKYQDISYVLVTIKTEQGAFNLQAAKSIVEQLDMIPYQEGVDYIRTGAIFYSYDASEQAQWEMKVLGGLSILATVLLILFSYRRWASLLTTVFLISVSAAYGFAGLQLFFTEINILSIVFAITLIGIAADYSFHSLTELQSVPATSKKPLAAIKMSLILSFITTALGYLLLTIVPIVIFKQIAVFTIFGLLGALVTVLLLFPYLHKKCDFSRDQQSNFYTVINQYHQYIVAILIRFKVAFSAIVILCLAALLQVTFSDNAKGFYKASEQLNNAEQRVKLLLGQKFDNQYLLTRAQTEQELLEREEILLAKFERLKSDKVIGDYQAISTWLPSIKQQKADNALLIQAQQQQSFGQLAQMLGQSQITVNPITAYIEPRSWLQTPLGKTFGQLWRQDANYYYALVRFSGINDVPTLANELSALEHSIFVDKLAETEVELGLFRTVLAVVFLMACIAALIVFTVRYGIKKALCGIFVPAFAFASALVLSDLLQDSLTLFNLAAGLVILALGLDYSVFYAEHGFSAAISQTTFMSALSSIFVFAILSFSNTPAIASFGQTVFFGIMITFICAPLISQIGSKVKRENERLNKEEVTDVSN